MTTLDLKPQYRKLSYLRDQAVGVYVHIPFCRRKCRYCDFYSVTELGLRKPFIQCILKEIQASSQTQLIVDTIYFGGGTPSIIAPSDIGRILDAFHQFFRIVEGAEITIEVNPGSVTEATLAEYHQLGIRRLNVGVQSFNDSNLRFLGRIHTAVDAIQTVDRARRSGFDNVGLDLIYGIPGQDERDWKIDIAQAVALAPEHLACYLLTFEDGTSLRTDLDAGRIRAPEGAMLADLLLLTVDYLNHHGYAQYEISNFSRFGSFKSRHNSKYWSGAPYIGFGPSAHSFLPPTRIWNVADLPGYLNAVESGGLPIGGHELLTDEQMKIERLFLGLRQTDGIDIKAFDAQFATSFTADYLPVIESLSRIGLIEIQGDRCRLSPSGMVLMDSIVDQFVG